MERDRVPGSRLVGLLTLTPQCHRPAAGTPGLDVINHPVTALVGLRTRIGQFWMPWPRSPYRTWVLWASASFQRCRAVGRARLIPVRLCLV